MKEITIKNKTKGFISVLAILVALLFFDTDAYTQSIDLPQANRGRITDWRKDLLLSNKNSYDAMFPGLRRDTIANFKLTSSGDAENIELVGRWANGPCEAVAVKGDTAYFGNGGYLEIVDFSDPAYPIELGKVLVTDFIYGVVVSGGFAYVADDEAGLRVIDVYDPTHPVETGYFDTGGNARGVAVSGGYAYVADYEAGLRVIDVSDPTNPFETGYFDTGGQALGVTLNGGFAYVADGMDGLRMINISDPTNPIEAGYFDTISSAYGVAISGGFAYVADFAGGLRVIDVSDPTNPFETGYTLSGWYAMGVAVSGSFAYVAYDWYGLQVIDVSDPTNPFETGYFDTGGLAWGVAVSGGYAYVADRQAGLRVIDVSDPNNPFETGYFHTGGYAYGVALSGGFAYVADNEAGLRVIDVSDPTNPVETGYFDTGGYAYGVAVSGGFVYVADYLAGLRVIDVSDPTNPVETGYFDTGDYAMDVAVSGGYAYVADYGAGLRVINVSDPTNPFEAGYFVTGSDALCVAVSGSLAYVADYLAGLRVINVSDPTNPVEIGYFDTGGYAHGVAVSGGYAYVADDGAGLRVIDVSDPTNPFETGYFDTDGYARGVAVSEGLAYVADWTGGLRVIDVSDPTNPFETGYFDTGGYASGVAVSEGFVYVTDEWYGLYILRFGEKFTLINPENNLEVTTQEVSFQWSNINAQWYELMVDEDSDFSSPEISKQHIDTLNNFQGTEFTISGNWLTPGIQYWKVIAFFSENDSTVSDVWQFTYSPPLEEHPVWVSTYRMYNSSDKDHFYCTSDNHRQIALNSGYTTERVDGYLSLKPFNSAERIPIYRFYDRTRKCHYYTSSETDKDTQIQNDLRYEGITGYAYSSQQSGTRPLYHLHKDWPNPGNSDNSDHFYTISQFEKDNAFQNYGFTYDGITAYVSETGANTYIPYHPAHIQAGDGINALNGNFRSYSKSSFYVPSIGIPLVFEHVYNSLSMLLHSSLLPLGPGWSHSYHTYIDFAFKPDTIAVVWPMGNIDQYAETGGSYTPAFKFIYDELKVVSESETEFEIKKKDQTIYTFKKLSGSASDSLAMLTSVRDKNGNTLTCDYEPDGLHRLISVTEPAGRQLIISYYTDQGKERLIKQVTDPLNRTIQFEYDEDGLLSNFTDMMRRETEYYYVTNSLYGHLLHEIKLPKGNIINNEYLGRKIKSQNLMGLGTLTFNENGNQVTITNAEDITVDIFKTTFGGIELPDKIQDDLGNEVDPVYTDSDNPSKPTQITDPTGNVTTFSYGDKGNVLEIHQPMSVNHVFEYDTKNNLTQYTDPRSKVTNFSYDANGNLTQISDPMSHTIKTPRYSNGLIQSITNPNGHTTNFSYDQYGNLYQIQSPLSLTSTFQYDLVGRMTQFTNPKNQTKGYDYFANDLLHTVTDAANGVTTYGYDTNDNLTSIADAKNQTTDWNYNDQDLLTSISNPLGNQKRFEYYDDGRLKNRIEPNGAQTSYTYDAAGRLTGVSAADISATFTLYNDGKINTVSDNHGTMSFNYDGLRRLTSYTDFYGNTVSYGYNAASNITRITYPGNKMVSYEYYDDNRLYTVKDWNNHVTTYLYKADGSLQQINYPNGVKAIYSYDDADRLTGISIEKSGGEKIASYQFTLDEVGNIINSACTEPFGIPSLSVKDISLTYNSANRLLTAGSNSYAINDNGNTTQISGAKNLTYTWDSQNRLTGMSGDNTASYMYDIFGHRRQATRNGATVRYVLDLNGPMSQVLMETDANNNPIAYYVHGLGLICRIGADGTTTHYYHFNNIGSTIAMTDQNQNITHKYSYYSFGQVLESEEAFYNPFRFVGQFGVMDEGNDLYFMRARFYDADVGRFISEDPVWDLNLFTYARLNPNIYNDPRGSVVSVVAWISWKAYTTTTRIISLYYLKKELETHVKAILSYEAQQKELNINDPNYLYKYDKIEEAKKWHYDEIDFLIKKESWLTGVAPVPIYGDIWSVFETLDAIEYWIKSNI